MQNVIEVRDYSQDELNEGIEQWILNERNRAIMRRRLIDGIGYERLAEEFDLSVTQIKRICKECRKVLFRHI